MGWADNYIKQLQAGETISFRPRGNSMAPRIRSGQLVTVQPVIPGKPLTYIYEGDIVLCQVKGSQYLHLVTARQFGNKDKREYQYQISNNLGRINGWIGRDKIYGKVISID